VPRTNKKGVDPAVENKLIFKLKNGLFAYSKVKGTINALKYSI
jgi:hypothetical protein